MHMTVGISVSDLGCCLALMKLQNLELAASISQILVRQEGAGTDLGWLASANTNTCGIKACEICKRSLTAVLTIGSFFRGESCWLFL